MKNKIIIYGLYFLAIGFIFSGCEEKVVDKFDAAPSLYFYEGNWNLEGEDQKGEFSYSFFYVGSDVTQDTLWIDVRLNGFTSNEDRAINLIQINSGDSAAVAGKHYIGFDDPVMQEALVMPANEDAVLIPIIMKKTADMETNEFVLDFELVGNDYFVPGIIEHSTFSVTMTAMAVKPQGWDSYYDYAFGEWGQEKMRFLIEYVGYTDFSASLGSYDLYKYYNLKARAALEAYEAENGPIYESDGVTRVIFP
ncbi:DUF4843 domain-containing protein [uncultured Draconibacterium sp.]|uniref:DUF4843 domain-containing protein n=1 Tax=uncultured Draconibacterium sp. TaxID=1573823 RepID=UPI0029C8F3CB|nr:DUF4843 domain-containing protein [uncultured Draconibacterium sp.]